MAGFNSNEITVAARTFLHLAPVGTTAPADATVALGASWLNVGATTPDGTQFTTSPTFQEVPTAQSDYPAIRFQTADDATLAVVLLQWNLTNFKAVYGGGSITTIAGSPTQYKFNPPIIGEHGETAAILESVFGTKRYRFVFPRVMQTEGVQLDLQRGQESRLPLSFKILGSDSVLPWYLLTNDPAFAS